MAAAACDEGRGFFRRARGGGTMPRVVQHVHIPRPPGEVFAFLTDFARLKDVLPGMVEARVLTDGPMRKGSRIAETREAQGRLRKSELVITVHEPPRRLWMDVLARGRKAGESGYLLEPTGEGGTRMAHTIEFRLPGLTKLLAPLIKPSVRKAMALDLQAVADHLARQDA